jgi:hypothetical protein
MGQSRQEFGFHGRGDAAAAGDVVGINGLLSVLYVAKPSKWLLPPEAGSPARAAGAAGTVNRRVNAVIMMMHDA